jgi:hypothetical protein
MIYLPKYNLAFFHMMKCGGTSIQHWLREYEHEEVKKIAWHEPLKNKADVLGDKFYHTRVFTLIRNPYNMIVSFYTFWRQMPRETSGDTIIAHDNTFTDFLFWYLQIMKQDRTDGPYRLKDYLCINDRLPPNLTIIKLDNLQKEMKEFLNRYYIPIMFKMYCDNISIRNGSISSYYN